MVAIEITGLTYIYTGETCFLLQIEGVVTARHILLQILKEDPDIENAEERYRQFVADEKLREKYQDRIKAERDRCRDRRPYRPAR